MRWQRVLAGAGLLAGASAVAASRRAQRRLSDAVTARIDLLDESERRRHLESSERVRFDALGSLPPPVQRYFRYALRDGQPFVRSARFLQRGTFRISESPERWCAFNAEEVMHAQPPGFVWTAHMAVLPPSPWPEITVLDSYVDGVGSSRAAAFGFPFGGVHDGPEVNPAALVRYLAEAPWIPTTLLQPHVMWSELDNDSALAAISDGRTTVSLHFTFSDAGEIVGCSTSARTYISGDRIEIHPWGGRYYDYEERAGMRIPARAEVFWSIDGEERAYFKGTVTNVEYEFAISHEP